MLRNHKQEFSEGFEVSRGRCKFLKPENVVPGNEYAITLNPAIQPDRLGPVGLKKFWDQQYGILETFDWCTFHLYPEVSAQGRFHFHGTMIVKDTAKFYYFDVPRIVQHYSCEMDTIKDIDVWMNYCSKQQSFMQDLVFREIRGLTQDRIKDKYDHYFVMSTHTYLTVQ